MVSTIESGAICGISCILVRVEVDAAPGLPCLDMVGYLGSEVREAKERVRVALKNIGVRIPPLRITVNLSPGDVRKEGTAFDLPIAVGILEAIGAIPQGRSANMLFVGELGLNGEIRPVRGVLPIVQEAVQNHVKVCVVPSANAREGTEIEGINILAVDQLSDVLKYLQMEEKESETFLPFYQKDCQQGEEEEKEAYPDFSDICGQEVVKRGVEIGAAGFHHILIVGPPGSGKTMIAKRIPGILPPLSKEESLEVSGIYSVAGKLMEHQALIHTRPFLNPHHTISVQALAGGGRVPRPGVISLAHRGVLFLDELTEFKRATLDIMRQPIEDKTIQIARAYGSYSFPADFMLVGAMNLCPCGHYPDMKRCKCTPFEVQRYLNRVSGPLLDRIDISVEAREVDILQLNSLKKGESSEKIRERVLIARERQRERYAGTKYRFNSDLEAGDINKYCTLGKKESKLMENTYHTMKLSARAYHRLLKVARTIADLDGKEMIEELHLTEAICYRVTDTRGKL